MFEKHNHFKIYQEPMEIMCNVYLKNKNNKIYLMVLHC